MLEIRRELKNSRTGEETEFTTTVVIKMTETELSFEFFCKNSKFFSADNKYNGPIFDGDVCEAFISTDGTINNYYEIEVAPNNCVFLMKITNHGKGDIELEPINECFVESQVVKNGNDYVCKFSVPLDKIGYDKEKGILFNAFRIETDGGTTDKYLIAWQPACDNTFHRPDFFVKL